MTQPPPSHLEQLKRALDAGLIDQGTYNVAASALTAQQSGTGAIAQGVGANAVGAGGVGIQGDNNGLVSLGVLIQNGSRPGASRDELMRAYLARVFTQANLLPLSVGDNASKQVKLSSVYTALVTERGERDAPGVLAAQHMRMAADLEAKRLSALDVLNAESKLVLLGGPGSGKSTFVNFLALSIAGERLGLADGPNLASLTAPLPIEDGDSENAQPQKWDHGALLPVRVVLRDLASQLPEPSSPVNAQTVWQFINDSLRQAALGDFAPFLHEEMLRHGALVMMDGLDEVPDALDRRDQIKQAVEDFVATFSRCRFLVTGRTYAYQRQDWKLDDFTEVQLLAFTPGQIQHFLAAWYAQMVELLRLTESTARDRVESLHRAVARNPRIRELAERPLLLTLIAQLQTEGGGTLPEKSEELYDKAVEMLLNKWENMKVRERPDGTKEIEPSLAEWLNAGRDDIRKMLNRLAFEAHRDQPQLTGTADIRQAELVAALLGASARREEVRVGLLERYLRDRAGILVAHGVDMYQFPHRSFQEYLAACHLTDDDFPEKLAELTLADPNRWREVTLLAGAKAGRGSSLSAWALCEALCFAPTEGETAPAEHWGALLAGRVLAECADLTRVAPRNAEKLELARRWQISVLRGDCLAATERALAGRTLALLGDPRPEVMTLDAMQFCYLPPESLTMGDDSWSDEEKPQHGVHLGYPAMMARFPVSVAQWREYLKRSGCGQSDDRGVRGRDNDPVIYVSWHDALRCCDYLTEAWRDWLPEGWIATLPSEAEWEKAARGGEHLPEPTAIVSASQVRMVLCELGKRSMKPNPDPARDYPWGDAFDSDRANTDSSIGESSALGAYPAGASPYGCEEMSGNVYEWTRSLWGTDLEKADFGYPYLQDNAKREDLKAGDEVLRVVRGGAWYHLRDHARCAFRYRVRPASRVSLLGFRVVLCSVNVGRP